MIDYVTYLTSKVYAFYRSKTFFSAKSENNVINQLHFSTTLTALKLRFQSCRIFDITTLLFLLDTRREFSVHKMFGGCPGRFLNILCAFRMDPVSNGSNHGLISEAKKSFGHFKLKFWINKSCTQVQGSKENHKGMAV